MANLNLPKVDRSIFDGRTVIDIRPYRAQIMKDGKKVYSCYQEFPKGDQFSPRPYILFWYKVPATGDILARKLYLYETLETTVIDKDGNTRKRKSPQELFRLEVCRACGLDLDIDGAVDWLEDIKDKHAVRAYIEKNPCLDEDGELRKDQNGTPLYWYKMRLASPEQTVKAKPETGTWAEPEPERAAEAEAKRAKRGKRGYAGNTGE